MAERFYFDTSIWLDFYEKRGRNGEQALRLIIRIIEEDLTISYSDLNIKELKSLGYSSDEIGAIFNIKPSNLMRIHIYKKQMGEARRIARERKLPRGDVLQAILARDNDLQLISRDKHFENLKDLCETRKPGDFT